MTVKSASLVLATVALLMPLGLRAQHGHNGVAGSGIRPGAYSGSVPGARPVNPNLGSLPYGLRTDIPTPI
ncbi:MAG: hypothetical protein ACJ74Y_12855, partial [Bryobacteraceae bacterium]